MWSIYNPVDERPVLAPEATPAPLGPVLGLPCCWLSPRTVYSPPTPWRPSPAQVGRSRSSVVVSLVYFASTSLQPAMRLTGLNGWLQSNFVYNYVRGFFFIQKKYIWCLPFDKTSFHMLFSVRTRKSDRECSARLFCHFLDLIPGALVLSWFARYIIYYLLFDPTDSFQFRVVFCNITISANASTGFVICRLCHLGHGFLKFSLSDRKVCDKVVQFYNT